MIATNKKAPPKIRYGILTDSSELASTVEIEPKMARLTMSGPMVVPKLFIPPAILNRCEPVLALPILIANGLAAVCCSENPRPMVNNPEINNGKEDRFAAGINSKVPSAEIINPKLIPFL